MSYRHLLVFLGVVLIALGLAERVWFLMAVWLGCDFLGLGIAHGRGSHRVFGKRADGTLPLWSWFLFLPLLIYTAAVWHLVRLFSREPAFSAVTERLVVGRRLLSSELDADFDNFVDLTAEFSEPWAIRHSPSYRSFPILDGAAPTPEALQGAVSSLLPGRTFIHCAQGHGRTGLFALAVLLRSGAARSVEDGLQMGGGTRLTRCGRNMTLTPRANHALRLAEAEARILGHPCVGSQHLVLGLFLLGGGVHFSVLEQLGCTEESLRRSIVAIGPAQEQTQTIEGFTLGDSAACALERAERDAAAMSHTYTGTEHILLGLLLERDGGAATVFAGHKLDTRKARTVILKELGQV
jgi:hypothetical protein